MNQYIQSVLIYSLFPIGYSLLAIPIGKPVQIGVALAIDSFSGACYCLLTPPGKYIVSASAMYTHCHAQCRGERGGERGGGTEQGGHAYIYIYIYILREYQQGIPIGNTYLYIHIYIYIYVSCFLRVYPQIWDFFQFLKAIPLDLGLFSSFKGYTL